MTTAIDRLRKILDLEAKQAWRNRAVVGGLQAMCSRWAADAAREQADGKAVETIVSLLTLYPELDKERRQTCIQDILRVLSGDFSNLDHWSLAEPNSNTAQAASEHAAPKAEALEIPAGESGAVPGSSGESKQREDASREEKVFHKKTVPAAEATDKAQERVRKKKTTVKRSPHDLQASVEILSGIGKASKEQLRRIGIENVIDFVWHLPSRYEDYSQMRTISELEPGEQVTIIANLWDVRERKVGIRRHMVQGILADGTGTLHATWWNRYVVNQLTVGSTLRFSGKVGLYMGQKTLDNPSFEDLDDEMVETGRLTPIYRLTEGLSNKRLRTWISDVLKEFGKFISDPLPLSLRKSHKLLELSSALRQIHSPNDAEQLEEARRRLIFEELLYIQLGIQKRRSALQEVTAQSLTVSDEALDSFRHSLGFTLTEAQGRVLGEIRADLARTIPMTRLVQGDVGSGKTAVAAGAIFAAALNDAQAAMLAPTQILAEQHYRGIKELLDRLTKPDSSDIEIALLTGRVGGKERTDILSRVRSGEIDILVGTTAVIQEHVDFQNLALVVVDEQHRFGVKQRGALRRGNMQPHMLVMSATPIPRSLALTIYGDLDLSVIDQMPPGRTPVKTKWFMPAERERLYSFLRREVAGGRQGFIVYPLVEESEKLDAGAAVAEYDRLQAEIFPDQRLALLHGRMSGSEKDEVMTSFAQGEYDILVSTTVIEVGIDVPNATLIIIEDADRFGLAQLHQLRGRVGRGQHASYCALISQGKSADAEERLVTLQESNDGFTLAQKDLDMRGPGDFLGTRQSGLPPLKVAQLSDLDILADTQSAARDLLNNDPSLSRYPQLLKQVERFWRGHGDVS